MFLSNFRHLAIMSLSIIFLTLSACSDDKSLSLQSGSESSSAAGDIVFTFQQSDSTPAVLLNNRNVQNYIEYTGTQGVIGFEDVAFALVQGVNTLTITESDGTNSTQTFSFDDAGPEVSISSAVKSGTSINVSGTVEDPAGVALLQINDQNINVNANGSFSASIPESASYLVFAEDKNNGFKSADKYLPAGSSTSPMIRTTIDQTVLQSLNSVIAEAVNAIKPSEVFDAVNPLAALDFGGSKIAVNLTAFESQQNTSGDTIGTSSVALSVPQDGTGTISAVINMEKPLIGVTMNVTPADGSDEFAIQMNISADALKVDAANILLDINEEAGKEGELVVEFVGGLPLDLTNTKVDVVDAGTLSVVLANPITQFMITFVVDSLEGILSDVIPSVINGEIAKLMDGAVLGVDIEDEDLLFKVGVTDFSTYGGAIVADLSSQYKAVNPVNNDYAMGVKTSVEIDKLTGEISSGEALPLPNALGQINASVSFDFINQAMLFAYQSGLLNFNIVGTQTIIGALPTNTVVNEGDLRIQVSPSVPELHILDGDTQVNAQVLLNNFAVTISNRQNNAWSNLFEMNVSVDLLAGFGFDAENKALFLTATETAPSIVVENIKLFNFLEFPPGLINGVIDLVTPGLTDVLSSVQLPLPIPPDLPVQLKDISTVGANNNHLSLSLDADLLGIAALLFAETSTVAQ